MLRHSFTGCAILLTHTTCMRCLACCCFYSRLAVEEDVDDHAEEMDGPDVPVDSDDEVTDTQTHTYTSCFFFFFLISLFPFRCSHCPLQDFAMFNAGAAPMAGAAAAAAAAATDAAQAVIESNIDPTEWRLELERVGPQLQFSVQRDAKDWRSHLDQMQLNQTVRCDFRTWWSLTWCLSFFWSI